MRLSSVLVLALVALVGGCSSGPARDIGLDKLAPRKAEQELASGLKSYENGQYQQAMKHIQTALNSDLTFKSDRITAHKYLAFIHCVSERKKQCRGAFKDALEINPDMELTPGEAGHPIWGPIFRDAQAEQRQKK